MIDSCPHCGEDLTGRGSFGDNVYCKVCDITFETDFDYITYDSIATWFTGVEHEGKVDINEDI